MMEKPGKEMGHPKRSERHASNRHQSHSTYQISLNIAHRFLMNIFSAFINHLEIHTPIRVFLFINCLTNITANSVRLGRSRDRLTGNPNTPRKHFPFCATLRTWFCHKIATSWLLINNSNRSRTTTLLVMSAPLRTMEFKIIEIIPPAQMRPPFPSKYYNYCIHSPFPNPKPKPSTSPANPFWRGLKWGVNAGAERPPQKKASHILQYRYVRSILRCTALVRLH